MVLTSQGLFELLKLFRFKMPCVYFIRAESRRDSKYRHIEFEAFQRIQVFFIQVLSFETNLRSTLFVWHYVFKE